MRGTQLSTIVLFLLLLGSPAPAQDTEQMIRDGIALHDQGEFEQSAELFQRVLELYPENVFAAYELAFTYTASGQFERCIEVAEDSLRTSAQFENDPRLIAALHLMRGSCHSELGELEKAIEVFDNALANYPDSYELHFNMAIALGRHSEDEVAVQHLFRAIELNPRHPSPYYNLGVNFAGQGKDILTILSYVSFLQLEFNSKRCVSASRAIFDRLFSRVQPGEDGTLNVAVDVKADESFEGLTTLDMGMATAVAAHATPEGAKEPIAESLAATLAMFIDLTAELEYEGDPESPIAKYLLANAKRLSDNDLSSEFSWFAAFTAGAPGTDDWPQTHAADADALSEYFTLLGEQSVE